MAENFNTSQVHSAAHVNSVDFFITSEQHLVISELLPKGYSLQFSSKPVRQKYGSFNKGITSSQIQSNSLQYDGQLRNSNGYSTSQFDESTNNCNNQQHYYSNEEQDGIAKNEYGNYLSNQDFSYQYKKRLNSKKRDKRRSDKNSKLKRRSDRFQGFNVEDLHQEDLKKWFSILQSLQKHKCATPFLWPVDPIMQGCPDYFMIIKDPMDLSTVEKNLQEDQYNTSSQFASDVRKIWNNSYVYNSKDTHVYSMTLEMDKYFEKKYKDMENQVQKSVMEVPYYYVKMLAEAIKDSNLANHSFQRSHSIRRTKNIPSKMDMPMTMQEKRILGQNIMSLPQECLHGIWDIIEPDADQQFEDKVLINIDTLSVRKTRQLEQFVKQRMIGLNRRLSKKQNKIEDKSSSSDNKMSQQTFSQDDETAITHHESINLQDYYYSDVTQTSIGHSYQVPQQQNQQYQSDLYSSQTFGSYPNSKQYSESNMYEGMYPLSKQGTGERGRKNSIRDNDSDTSFISGDSDSQDF